MKLNTESAYDKSTNTTTLLSQYSFLDRLGILIRLPLITLHLDLGQPLLLQPQLLRLGLDLVSAADHIKRQLGRVIVLAVHNIAEALNRIRQRHKRAGQTRKHLGDLEGLRCEALHLPRQEHNGLILLGQLVHAQNGNNIGERIVLLKVLNDALTRIEVAQSD